MWLQYSEGLNLGQQTIPCLASYGVSASLTPFCVMVCPYCCFSSVAAGLLALANIKTLSHHQVRIMVPRYGQAPTRVACTPTLWRCPAWVLGGFLSAEEQATVMPVWRQCWVRRSSWCTGPPWCPSACWTVGGSLYRIRTKLRRTSPLRQIWPTLTLSSLLQRNN